MEYDKILILDMENSLNLNSSGEKEVMYNVYDKCVNILKKIIGLILFNFELIII